MGLEAFILPCCGRKEGMGANMDGAGNGNGKGEGKGKGTKIQGKGKGKHKGKKRLEDFASEQLTPEKYLGNGMFSECFSGSFSSASGPIKVAIKPGLADLELSILEKLARCQPSPRGVVPVPDAAHYTPNGPVALLQLGTLGTLENALPRLCQAGAFGDEAFLALVASIAEGLVSLHELDIIHCDPKPDNIVLHADPATPDISVWLIDFGDARALDDPGSWWAGGPGAPGITCHADLGPNGHLSTKTDSWCLAQCAAVIWSHKIGSWWNPGNPARLDTAMPLHDILQRCLQTDPASRPSAGGVAEAAHQRLAAMGTEPARVLKTIVCTLQSLA